MRNFSGIVFFRNIFFGSRFFLGQFHCGQRGDLLFGKIAGVYHFQQIFAAGENTPGFGRADRKFHQIYFPFRNLVSGILLAPEINGIGARGEEFEFASLRAERILFFQNESADTGAFAVIFSGFSLFVDDTELRVGIIFAEIVELPDEKFVRNHRDDLVFSAFFQAKQSVIFIADDGVITFYGSSDITVFAIPADFDIVQRGSFAVDLFNIFDLGAAREVGSVFFLYIRKHFDGVVDQM